MMNEEQRTPGSGDEQHGSEVPAAESGATAPGSAGSSAEQPDLTVDDILGAEQNADAAGADEAADAENPYLEDLRRLSAEYANYRKRTEANAVIEKQRALASVVTSAAVRA